MNEVSENDWEAFVEQHRAAAKAELDATRRNPNTSQQAIAWCLESLRLYESLHGNPFVKDAVTLRKEEHARQAWVRLRKRWTQ